MQDLLFKESFSEDDINALILNGAEEHQQLDFKAGIGMQNNDSTKNELAKDVSSFANSEGGVLIYGIMENDHKASSLSFVNGNIITKEWIEQVINSRIQRSISGIKIHPLRFQSRIDESVYIIQVPPSQNSPHMAKDNKFYIRRNFESVPMEEYEIRNSYNKVYKSFLKIEDIIVRRGSSGGGLLRSGGHIEYRFKLKVQNLGYTIEEKFKCQIILSNRIYHGTNSVNNMFNIQTDMFESNNIVKMDFKGLIYPTEEVITPTFSVLVQRGTIIILRDNPIDILLFYSGGTQKLQINAVDEILKFQDDIREIL